MEYIDLMKYVVPIIVIGIIAFQVKLFIDNRRRMSEFSDIFTRNNPLDWDINKQSGFVDGITVNTQSSILVSIKDSINKYLGNNKGSIIDFSLLKDAVDRHCQTVEDEIQTQMPVPLYCGLAGTMLGVIIGLGSLLFTDSISFLMGAKAMDSVNTASGGAAQGVNDLLWGVAWAMVASICGITLTTVNSMLFKKCKLQEEEGKNDFLAWMQSKLLPELPSDTSQAMNNLVQNLNRFNNTFSSNNKELGRTLTKINESYNTSAQILESVRRLDITKMATANVKVLNELQECMPLLEDFKTYLASVKGYTDAIQRFTELFDSESERLHVLEEIRDFFRRHKGEIAKNLADNDNALKEALKHLNETSSTSIAELDKSLTDQADKFKTLNHEICESFSEQLKQMPGIMSRLNDLSEIPAKLLVMTKQIEKSNEDLVNSINLSNERMAKGIGNSLKNIKVVVNDSIHQKKEQLPIPRWLKVSVIVSLLLITLSSLATTTILIIGNSTKTDKIQTEISKTIVDGEVKSATNIQHNGDSVNFPTESKKVEMSKKEVKKQEKRR